MKKRIIRMTGTILACAACALQAETLINWGGTGMATADTDFSLPAATDTTNWRTWEYSATTPLLATGGNYAGPTLYGALQAANTNAPTDYTTAKVDDRGSNPDYITTFLNSATDGDQVRGLVFFKKADFANLSSDTIKFDSTSSATISVIGNNGAGGNRGPRLAVLEGSSWYVSSSYFGGFSGDLVIADLSTAMFAAYDPTGAPLDGTPASFTTAGSTFTNIQAVGYYFDLGTATARSAGMNIDGFEISAVSTSAPSPPAAPTGLTATGGYSVVELDWDDSGSDVANYSVYRSTSSGSSGSVLVSNLTTSAYSDSAVDNFTTYYYRVTAVGTNGLESSFSGQVSATPVQDPSGPPSAPTGLTADAGDASVSLDWDDNNDIDLAGYSVYRSTTSGSYLAGPLATNLLSSSYEDTNAVNGTTYYYVVTASDTNGLESAQSSEASATPVLDTPPSAPTGLTATAGNGLVSLDWNDNSEEDFDTYTVYRSATSGSYTAALASNLASSAYADSDVVNGTTYYYVVTATDTSGKESATSSEVSAKPEPLPLVPASFDFGTDSGKDTIEDAGLTTYIQDDTPGEMIVSNVADGISLHDALGGSGGREAMGFYRTFSGLGPNDTNDFVITTTFTTPIPNWNQPSIGIHLFGDVTSGSYWENGIYACVDKNENLEIWNDGVERGTIVGSGTISAEVVNGSVTTIRIEGTYGTYGTDNLQLVLTVYQPGVAINSITGTVDTTGFSISQTGFGVSSGTDDENKFIVDTLWVGPKSAAPPLPPTGLAATPADGSVSLDWNDSGADVASYKVYRSTTSGSYGSALASGQASSAYVDSSVVNGTTYYYVVTAVGTNGTESSQSAEVSATPADLTPPAAPTGLTATAGDAQVSLDWNTNTEDDFDTYSVYRATTSGGYSTALVSGLTSSSYVDESAVNDTTYYYVVTATDTSGNESGYSNEDSATPSDSGLQGYALWLFQNGVADTPENFYEYAMDSDPTDGLPSVNNPVLVKAGGSWYYVYPKRTDDETLTYTVETTTNLVDSGSWGTGGTTADGTYEPGGKLSYVSNVVDTAESERFIRLKIEQ